MSSLNFVGFGENEEGGVYIIIREKPERSHAAVLGGTLFLGRTVALTGSIFELTELHSRIHFQCYGK